MVKNLNCKTRTYIISSHILYDGCKKKTSLDNSLKTILWRLIMKLHAAAYNNNNNYCFIEATYGIFKGFTRVLTHLGC